MLVQSGCWRRVLADSRGNVAAIFAIALVPLLGSVGAAVEYSQVSQLRTKMQVALDSALLAGSVAGKQALDAGAGNATAISAATSAATNFFAGSTNDPSAAITTNFSVKNLTLTGTATASGSMPASFLKVIGFPTLAYSASSATSAGLQPYQNVYLLVDISASMLLPSTQSGIDQMKSGQGCALACHDKTDGSDSYGWALKKGIQLRYQVVNEGVQNLLTYLKTSNNLQSYVKVGLWSFDRTITQMSSLTSNYSSVSNNFPAPELAINDAAAATPFNSLIDSFVTSVGKAGDGTSSGQPQKLVIIATDGVNDPTRAWTSDTSLRAQVKVFDTAFCDKLKLNGVTVAIINTPYLPMTWDWGYNATLGQPGSLGGATRVDDIPIALKACAKSNFILGSDVATIQSAFTNLFTRATAVRVTN